MFLGSKNILAFQFSLTVSQTSKIKLKNVVGICDINIEYFDGYFRIQINHILNNAWLKGVLSLTYFNKTKIQQAKEAFQQAAVYFVRDTFVHQ
jgi:hypothetical protein